MTGTQVKDNPFPISDKYSTYTAMFSKKPYSLNVSAAKHGSTSWKVGSLKKPEKVQWGKTVKLTLSPDEGCGIYRLAVTDAKGEAIELTPGIAHLYDILAPHRRTVDRGVLRRL